METTTQAQVESNRPLTINDKADLAQLALDFYRNNPAGGMKAVGGALGAFCIQAQCGEGPQRWMIDLLTAMRHLADREKLAWGTVLANNPRCILGDFLQGLRGLARHVHANWPQVLVDAAQKYAAETKGEGRAQTYPPTENNERADRARQVIECYVQHPARGIEPLINMKRPVPIVDAVVAALSAYDTILDYEIGVDESKIADLVADCRHHADREKLSWDEEGLDGASDHPIVEFVTALQGVTLLLGVDWAWVISMSALHHEEEKEEEECEIEN